MSMPMTVYYACFEDGSVESGVYCPSFILNFYFASLNYSGKLAPRRLPLKPEKIAEHFFQKRVGIQGREAGKATSTLNR